MMETKVGNLKRDVTASIRVLHSQAAKSRIFPLQDCKIHTPNRWMSVYCYDNAVD